jgi:hypothetical protein
MKETPRRRITVTSSLNDISTDQQGNSMVVQRGGVTQPIPTTLHSRLIFKDDVSDFSSSSIILTDILRRLNVFSSSDICFMHTVYPILLYLITSK